MSDTVVLRAVTESDLPIFFEQQRDPEANYMAAFTSRDPNDRDAFMAHWARILADETTTNRTIVVDGAVAGNISSFLFEGEREVSYWLGKSFWGRGVASAALRAFLGEVTLRPLYARAAKDNAASLRVLRKRGFTITGEGSGYAAARGGETEEYILTLR